MRRLAILLLAMPAPAFGQPMDHSQHVHPSPSPASMADPHAGHAAPAPDPHAHHGDHATPAKPPQPPQDHLADEIFDARTMQRSRALLKAEHGGARVGKVMFDRLELRGDEGYGWDLEAGYGGDLHRLVLKSEGEGHADDGVEAADVQLLYARPVGVYTDLQVGVRTDLSAGASRSYAVAGFETLLPYWIEAEGALYLSDHGEVSGRLEAASDLRLTQRFILQPRVELGFALQDAAEKGAGRGFNEAEVGLRLRYEVARTIAPYVGVAYRRAFGRTAELARDEGERAERTQMVAGLRAWF